MKFRNLIFSTGLMAMILVFGSCVTTHPNEKLLPGTWKPQKVEPWISPEMAEQMKAQQETQKDQPAAQKTEPVASDPAKGKPTGNASDQRNKIDRLIGLEQRATLRIEPNHTVAKAYPGKTLKATWKLKANGTLLLAKNIETKEKYKIDLVEISPTHFVAIQHVGEGGVKITYVKEQ